MNRRIILGLGALILLVFGGGGCVSLRSYRNAKSQMIYSELMVSSQQRQLDSLQTLYTDLRGRTTDQTASSAELNELKAQLSRLQVEHALMTQELEQLRTMNNQ